jgi:hypothetical protein
MRFPIGIGLRVGLRLGGPFILFLAYKMAEVATNTFDMVAAGLICAMGVASVVGEPGEIQTTPSGLVQRSMLGLVVRKVAWDGAGALAPSGGQEVLVVGRDGKTITHSQHHVGRLEFIIQLERHGVAVVP